MDDRAELAWSFFVKLDILKVPEICIMLFKSY